MHGNITNIEEILLKIEQNSDKNGQTSLSISPKRLRVWGFFSTAVSLRDL